MASHQVIVALVDLALPSSSCSSGEIVEGISKSALLLQAAFQCRTSISCNFICSSKMNLNIMEIKGLHRGACGVLAVKQCLNCLYINVCPLPQIWEVSLSLSTSPTTSCQIQRRGSQSGLDPIHKIMQGGRATAGSRIFFCSSWKSLMLFLRSSKVKLPCLVEWKSSLLKDVISSFTDHVQVVCFGTIRIDGAATNGVIHY